MKLSQLKAGQSCIIESFSDEFLKLKLMEMGCIPGEIVEVVRLAPMGDPIAISVANYTLSMRKEEADTVIVRMMEDGSLKSKV
jgi:ferrous iron transport protein A